MKVTTEPGENCQVTLTVEVEKDELDKSLDEAYQRLVGRVSIPGFRKGKAPRSILEQHMGKAALLEEALQRLIPQLYLKAVAQEKLEPIDEPQMELVQTEPVIFKAVVSLKPEVKLGDYHSIKIDSEPAEVSQEEIEASLEQIRQQQAVLIPVDRPIQFGDVVTMDVEATMEDKPFLNHKDMLYEVDQNSGRPLPGIAQNLVNAEKNKVKVFTLDVPEDYGVKEFAGKKYSFNITPTEIKERQLLELDDELAQSAGYDNLAAMKEKVTAELKTRAEENGRLELRQKAIDAVVEISEVHYPPVLENKEIASLLAEEARQLGFDKVEDYMERTNRKIEEYREQLRPIAKKRIRYSLVLDKIAEQEKIEIAASEVDNKVEEIIGGAEDKEKAGQFCALPQVRESIEGSLRNQRTFDRLVEIVSASTQGNIKEE
ncbi:MAG: trigger factor [Chloroflexota bacterium]|nr:trigger factor [Chloroflexota bacterium]